MAEETKVTDGREGTPAAGIKRKVTKTKDLNPVARFRLKPINLKVLGLTRKLSPDQTKA